MSKFHSFIRAIEISPPLTTKWNKMRRCNFVKSCAKMADKPLNLYLQGILARDLTIPAFIYVGAATFLRPARPVFNAPAWIQ